MTTAMADGPEHRPDAHRGAWVDAVDGGRLESVDPTSERIVATFPDGGEQDVDRAVAAGEAAESWRDLGWARRGAILRELADRITEPQVDIGRGQGPGVLTLQGVPAVSDQVDLEEAWGLLHLIHLIHPLAHPDRRTQRGPGPRYEMCEMPRSAMMHRHRCRVLAPVRC